MNTVLSQNTHYSLTVTICPLPSLRTTTSQSTFSLESKHRTSVGSVGSVLIWRFSMKARPNTTSKWFSSDRYTVCVVVTADSACSPSGVNICSRIGHVPMLHNA